MDKVSKRSISIGAFGLALAILLGAMAAHYLKDKLELKEINVFETAVKYQFYGCLGLVLMGILNHLGTQKLLLPMRFLGFGILIFSGTLYFLALKTLANIEGLKWVGAITPLGGILMIISWIWVGVLFSKNTK